MTRTGFLATAIATLGTLALTVFLPPRSGTRRPRLPRARRSPKAADPKAADPQRPTPRKELA